MAPMPAADAGDPIAVLSMLFHLWWCGELTCDLEARLHQVVALSGTFVQLRSRGTRW